MPKNEKKPAKAEETTKTSKMKLSEKMSKLEKMVDWFYSDEFSLDDAEGKYRKAMELSAEIENDLNNLENKIEVISRDFSEKTMGDNDFAADDGDGDSADFPSF